MKAKRSVSATFAALLLSKQKQADELRAMKPLIIAVEKLGALNSSLVTDADRARLATRSSSGKRMHGPLEYEACHRHPGKFSTHRWIWNVGDAVEYSFPASITGCEDCDEEDDRP